MSLSARFTQTQSPWYTAWVSPQRPTLAGSPVGPPPTGTKERLCHHLLCDVRYWLRGGAKQCFLKRSLHREGWIKDVLPLSWLYLREGRRGGSVFFRPATSNRIKMFWFSYSPFDLFEVRLPQGHSASPRQPQIGVLLGDEHFFTFPLLA